MYIKPYLKMIPFIVFNLILVIFYIRSILYPVETDFWLIKFGIPILGFEMYGIMIGILVYGYLIPELLKKHETIKKIGLISAGLFFIIMFIISAYAYALDFNNIVLFYYFFLLISVKYFSYGIVRADKKRTNEILILAFKNYGIFILAAFIGLLSFLLFPDFMPEQSEILRQAANNPNLNAPYSNAIVGISYFSLLIIFEIFKPIKRITKFLNTRKKV